MVTGAGIATSANTRYAALAGKFSHGLGWNTLRQFRINSLAQILELPRRQVLNIWQISAHHGGCGRRR
jgi:hypothetical protein